MSGAAARTPVWLAPQVIVAGLLFLAATVYAVRTPAAPNPLPTVEFEPPVASALEPTEVELAVVEPSGLERIVFADVAVPDDDAGRFAAIFGALRGELVTAGVWPEAVPAPRVFLQRVAGRDVVVLDLDIPVGAAIDVESELRLVGSIDATAARHRADVRYLVNGAAAATLLGHVAVPGALAHD